MEKLKKLLSILKNNKKEIQIIKILVIIAINTWLLIIFWKILVVENVKVMSVVLTKIQTLLEIIEFLLVIVIVDYTNVEANTVKVLNKNEQNFVIFNKLKYKKINNVWNKIYKRTYMRKTMGNSGWDGKDDNPNKSWRSNTNANETNKISVEEEVRAEMLTNDEEHHSNVQDIIAVNDQTDTIVNDVTNATVNTPVPNVNGWINYILTLQISNVSVTTTEPTIQISENNKGQILSYLKRLMSQYANAKLKAIGFKFSFNIKKTLKEILKH